MKILRGKKPLSGRPGASIPAADFQQTSKDIHSLLEHEPSRREVVSHLLYPQVFTDFVQHQKRFSNTSVLPTPAFLYGLEANEEIAVDIESGKTLIVRFLTVSEPHEDGRRTVFFELNGQPREVTVVDQALEPDAPLHPKADPNNAGHVGASMPGMVFNVAVQEGDAVVPGQKLLTLEAMKMQTAVTAEIAGRIADIHVHAGTQLEAGDLLMTIEASPST